MKKSFCALIVLLFVSASAMAAYNPVMGRFLSRDPVDEKGFQILTGIRKDNFEFDPSYVFAHNDAINRWDYLGLEWQITREGGVTATACSDSPDDTIDSLAKKIGLDPNEYKKWLATSDNRRVVKFEPQKTYLIPNSFIIVIGRGGDWFLAYARKGAMRLYNALEKQGAYVLYLSVETGATKPDIIKKLSDSTVAGYALLGHGTTPLTPDGNDGGNFLLTSPDIDEAGRKMDYANATILPSEIQHPFKYAVGVNYFCYAKKWKKLSVVDYTAEGQLYYRFYWNWFSPFIGGYDSFARKYFHRDNQ